MPDKLDIYELGELYIRGVWHKDLVCPSLYITCPSGKLSLSSAALKKALSKFHFVEGVSNRPGKKELHVTLAEGVGFKSEAAAAAVRVIVETIHLHQKK